MSSDQLKGFSSAFDAMLERNRRALDALTDSSKLAHSSSASARPLPAARESSRSAAERTLDEKLGPGWRYDVLERTRDGDDVIVRCRVTQPSRGLSRTQFGSASASADGGHSVQGRAGNVSFSFGAGASPSTESHDPLSRERDAERAAIEAALMACARLL